MQRRGVSRQPSKGQRQRPIRKGRKVPTEPTSIGDRDGLLDQRTRERDQAVEQLAARSEVLKVISGSPGELEPVLQPILAHGTRLCEANYGAMWLKEGDRFRNVGFHGVLAAAYTEKWRSATVGPAAPL